MGPVAALAWHRSYRDGGNVVTASGLHGHLALASGGEDKTVRLWDLGPTGR